MKSRKKTLRILQALFMGLTFIIASCDSDTPTNIGTATVQGNILSFEDNDGSQILAVKRIDNTNKLITACLEGANSFYESVSDDGLFTFNNIPAGRYTLSFKYGDSIISYRGNSGQIPYITVTENAVVELLNIRISGGVVNIGNIKVNTSDSNDESNDEDNEDSDNNDSSDDQNDNPPDNPTPRTSPALQLDGTGDFVKIEPVPAPHHIVIGLNDFTVEAWIKLNNTVSHQRIFSQVNGMGDQDAQVGISFSYSADEQNLRLRIFGAMISNTFSDPSVPVSGGEWVHVAVSVVRNGNATYYVNGIFAGSYDVSNAVNNDLGNFDRPWGTYFDCLGARPQENGFPTDNFLNGYMDEVRVWSCARSQADIVNNMYNSLTSGGGLLAYYNFDDNTANDASGNGYHGTLEGNATIATVEVPSAP